MASKSIFISHAIANKELADMLVDLLETAIGVDHREIFCSSLEGMGIPSGTDFIHFIKSQIKEPKIVILLLSKEYFNSQFCLCELGASWVMSHKTIPLLVPPLEFKDIKAVLLGKQLLRITEKNDLNEMQSEIIKALGIKGKSFARWEIKRSKFLKELSGFLKEYKPVFSITENEYKEIENNYKDAIQELEQSEITIETLEKTIEKLKKVKDKEAVNDILSDNMDIIQKFEEMTQKAKNAIGDLPYIVEEVLYYDCRGESMGMPGFGEDERDEELKYAAENDYIEYSSDGISLVEDDPTVEKAISALRDLEEFIYNSEVESEDLNNYYSQEYDHRLNFKSRRFWDTHLF